MRLRNISGIYLFRVLFYDDTRSSSAYFQPLRYNVSLLSVPPCQHNRYKVLRVEIASIMSGTLNIKIDRTHQESVIISNLHFLCQKNALFLNFCGVLLLPSTKMAFTSFIEWPVFEEVDEQRGTDVCILYFIRLNSIRFLLI